MALIGVHCFTVISEKITRHDCQTLRMLTLTAWYKRVAVASCITIQRHAPFASFTETISVKQIYKPQNIVYRSRFNSLRIIYVTLQLKYSHFKNKHSK